MVDHQGHHHCHFIVDPYFESVVLDAAVKNEKTFHGVQAAIWKLCQCRPYNDAPTKSNRFDKFECGSQ